MVPLVQVLALAIIAGPAVCVAKRDQTCYDLGAHKKSGGWAGFEWIDYLPPVFTSNRDRNNEYFKGSRHELALNVPDAPAPPQLDPALASKMSTPIQICADDLCQNCVAAPDASEGEIFWPSCAVHNVTGALENASGFGEVISG